ncbi:MAG: hypothetical protein GC190_19245 [Alphaproteobacteria bacterium]|nr:hypothetical protein [Alphaproteobacteria bacterium]
MTATIENDMVTLIGVQIENARGYLSANGVDVGQVPEAPVPPRTRINPPERATLQPRPIVSRETSTGASAALGKMERAILGVLLQHFDTGLDRGAAALMAGYSAKSGSFANAISKLRTAGLLAAGDPLHATEKALKEAGHIPALPTGAELLAYWCAHKVVGKAERAILTEVVNAYPRHVKKTEVADRTGYSAQSGSFANSLWRLRTLGLISGKTELVAADAFGR